MKVAIVGHDKTLPGAGLGPEIDRYDYVVKMLNCAWHDPADYGSRYDYAIATKSSFVMAAIKVPAIEIWGYEKRGGNPNFNGHGARDITPSIKDCITDLLPVFAGGHVPAGISRGCAAVLGALAILEPGIITLYGMGQIATGTRQEDRHPDIYRDQLTEEQASVLPADQDHNWLAESRLIYYMAGVHKCVLRTNTSV